MVDRSYILINFPSTNYFYLNRIRNGAARVKVFIDRNVVALLPNEPDEGCVIGDFVLGRSGDTCRAQVDGSECAGELHTTHGIEIAHVMLGETIALQG